MSGAAYFLDDLPSAVGDALGDIFYDAVLTRGGSSYNCKAIHETWQRSPDAGGALTTADAKLLVLAASLAVRPQAGDAVSLQGVTYVVFSGSDTVGAVQTDPAEAVWTLTCKAAPVQGGVYGAYAALAQALGAPFDQYRPSGPSNPLATKLRTLPAQFVGNTSGGKFAVPNAYGKPLWQVLVDGTQTQPGDYLVGSSGTYFIAAMQPLLPILAVECNRRISISTAGITPGNNPAFAGWSGETAAAEALPGDDVMNGWPASVLQGSRGEGTPERLPSDTRSAWWSILLPAVPGVIINFGMLVTDDLGRRYTVSSAELTDLGWRLTAGENNP